jgi:hypothetical protein
LHPTLCRRAVGAAVSTAAVVFVRAALAEAVLTPPDLVAAVFTARRLAGADSGPDSGTDSGLA